MQPPPIALVSHSRRFRCASAPRHRPHHRPLHRSHSGHSLLELLVVLMLIGIIAAVAYPAAADFVASSALRGVAGSVSAKVRALRARAAAESRYIGMRFEDLSGRGLVLVTYLDGNGNGIRTADIRKGIDRCAGPAFEPRQISANARFGILNSRIPDPSDPSHFLDPDRPIRFGASGILSFSPLGESSPGSLYLTDGLTRMAAIRVNGHNGKVRLLTYSTSSGKWRPR